MQKSLRKAFCDNIFPSSNASLAALFSAKIFYRLLSLLHSKSASKIELLNMVRSERLCASTCVDVITGVRKSKSHKAVLRFLSSLSSLRNITWAITWKMVQTRPWGYWAPQHHMSNLVTRVTSLVYKLVVLYDFRRSGHTATDAPWKTTAGQHCLVNW